MSCARACSRGALAACAVLAGTDLACVGGRARPSSQRRAGRAAADVHLGWQHPGQRHWHLSHTGKQAAGYVCRQHSACGRVCARRQLCAMRAALPPILRTWQTTCPAVHTWSWHRATLPNLCAPRCWVTRQVPRRRPPATPAVPLLARCTTRLTAWRRAQTAWIGAPCGWLPRQSWQTPSPAVACSSSARATLAAP